MLRGRSQSLDGRWNQLLRETVIESARTCIASQQRLQNTQRGRQLLLDILVLRLDHLLLPDRMLQFPVRLLRRQLLDAPLQRLDLAFRPLANRPLSLAVVGSLLGQLLGRQVRYPAGSRRRGSPLLGGGIEGDRESGMEAIWGGGGGGGSGTGGRRGSCVGVGSGAGVHPGWRSDIYIAVWKRDTSRLAAGNRDTSHVTELVDTIGTEAAYGSSIVPLWCGCRRKRLTSFRDL